MNKILSTFIFATIATCALSSCIEEEVPQNGTPTVDQVNRAPNAFQNMVSNLTANLSGKRNYSPNDAMAFDFGYTSFFLTRDVEGQDIVAAGGNNWYHHWYSNVSNLSAGKSVTQFPWTCYYGWISDCNVVIRNAGASNYATPIAERKVGAGIAYAMRAMFYLDLVRMYAAKPYAVDHNALTTIKADETRTVEQARHQERMTWTEAFAFILKDLDTAEQYLTGYTRTDKYTPDISVVYGLKARTYLEMQDWAKAEHYAHLAQNGYSMMSQSEYLSRDNGFNTPNDSWMFATRFVSTDPNISGNDGDDSWGSMMLLENGFGGGYAQNYGGVQVIDQHLYSTIPATDFRKKCWVDFSLDAITSKPAAITALGQYSNYPDRVYAAGKENASYGLGGLSLKFRNAAGMADTKYSAWCVSVPLMRVEEMKLIEAEAAGMQNLSRGINLLTQFAQTRDASYVYGTHNEAYGNTSTPAFQNEVWWQRRVELWGEGFATFDIKRLNKGIIRSYANTNHLENARWNTTSVPNWMVWAFVGTESDNNNGMTQNPDPVQPTSDSTPHVW
ncbi:MAG: RagB/SusD family nutrient uptake outer membrane protein [Prevotella sp.]|jgi:putative outer membrane protein|nr:RagB/SusD family nutrient uptake outer membrane protein [Prevotella sp.]